jgi:gliding motility-associated-like protein
MAETDTTSVQNPIHKYTTVGAKTIILEIEYKGVPGCTSSKSVNTSVVDFIKPEISASLASLCPGDSTILSIAGEFKTIAWSNNEDSNSISLNASGDYSVTTTDNNDCEASDEITIESKEAPELTASSDKEVVTLGQAANLSASGAATYAWSPKESLDDSTKSAPVAKPSVTTTYVVKGATAEGCTGEASVTVRVTTEGIGISPPVLFTPNNDGNNDFWVILGVENYQECSLNVFDSKGRRVYEKTGYQNDWEAKLNGDALPEGVYYFVFGCTDEKPVTGTVTVVR